MFVGVFTLEIGGLFLKRVADRRLARRALPPFLDLGAINFGDRIHCPNPVFEFCQFVGAD